MPLIFMHTLDNNEDQDFKLASGDFLGSNLECVCISLKDNTVYYYCLPVDELNPDTDTLTPKDIMSVSNFVPTGTGIIDTLIIHKIHVYECRF